MSEESEQSIQDLIQEIEKKDRRFRLAQFIFNSLLVIMLGVGSYILYEGNQQEQARRDEATASINQSIENKVQELKDQIDCLGQFFQRPDRQNLVVDSKKKCEISKIADADANDSNSVGSTDSNKNDNTKQNGSTPNNSQTPQKQPETINPNQPGLRPDPEPQPEPEQPNLIERTINFLTNIF